MTKQKSAVRALSVVIALLLVMLAGTTCTNVRLISNYDEIIDRSVTDLQKKVDTFLVMLERNSNSAQASYENNRNFYDEVRVDLRAIQVRAASHPKNERTIAQLKLVEENLAKLEKIHKEGVEAGDELTLLRNAFERQFTAILILELAKKRGDKKTS